jgi:hypothetical protein
MNRRCIWAVLAFATACLSASDASAYLLRGSVLGNGATRTVNSSYRLLGTVGQPVIGLPSSSATRVLCHGYWCFGGSRTVSVELPGGPTDLPTLLELGPATPNPARGAISFALALPKAADVRLTAYDVRGRQVGDPLEERFPAGYHTLYWRAAEEGVSSGVYFVRLFVSGGMEAERRFVILR